MDNGVYTIDTIRSLLTATLNQYGVDKAYVFGSYARNEATPDSDIDIMIKSEEIKSLFVLGGLFEDIKKALNKGVDLITEEAYTHPYADDLAKEFYSRVVKERTLIYER